MTLHLTSIRSIPAMHRDDILTCDWCADARHTVRISTTRGTVVYVCAVCIAQAQQALTEPAADDEALACEGEARMADWWRDAP